VTIEILSLTRSKLRQKLLRYFFLHPGESFYLRELERTLDLSVGNIRRELKKLEQLGLFTLKKMGNLSYYSLNKNCPFYNELRGIILKTSGLGDAIKDALEKISEIKFAFIYGSFARGEEISSSDVDLMIIGNVDRSQLTSKLYEIEKKLGRQVNLLVYSTKEWFDRIKKKNVFIGNILKGKLIMLIGDESELRRIKKR
jgi:predicted nucleotidyltransferase/predicted transcriptional regulator with HTH domain